MLTIKNPILPGFHGDPCVVRVGEDYYIVTSSFEWFPGAPLYHSKDLRNWRLLYNILDTRELLDLTGVRPSFGVWAPDLSYCEAERRFYLLYSNVHCRNKWLFDVDNYLIWTDDIESGEWSRPLYINSSGFDPSLFHDDDGRKWVVNKDRDFRPRNVDRRTIILQELDIKTGTLLGAPKSISHGATERRFVEGPHLYKRDGMYYLMTAEGGTGYGHCVALLRSKNIGGPYEPSPYGPVITSNNDVFSGTETVPFMMMERYNPEAELQKAGHGSLVETQAGEWYVVHLCGRPVMPQQRCILGRETAIQRVEWTGDGWLRMPEGNLARLSTPAPAIPEHPFPPESPLCDFDGPAIPKQFYTPRNEIAEDWASVSRRKGHLSLRGRESLTSNYYPSLLARKLTAFHTETTVRMEFAPELYHHIAGLACYYDMCNHHIAFKSHDEELGGAILSIASFINGELTDSGVAVPVGAEAPVWLRAHIRDAELQFLYSLDGERFLPLGGALDLSPLSDEESPLGSFTGTFIGMFAQDSDRKQKWADFDWFRYEILE
ncbi:MAG: glycoside hydrolase family 43 protein [Clostridiales bacterium]|nr:glycoside hydrolase family 43 protein [Clostridiales bacterium]